MTNSSREQNDLAAANQYGTRPGGVKRLFGRPAFFILFFLFSWAAAIAAGAEKPADKQAAVPDAAAVAKAEGQAAELFGQRIERAKRPADKSALGREILDAARKSADDPAAQYVLARLARGLGAEAKDWPLTLAAVGLIAERFDAGKHEPEALLRYGDEAAARAKRAEGKGRRQEWQLIAAEWYCRARLSGKGLNIQLADKRLGELAAAMGCRDKDAYSSWSIDASKSEWQPTILIAKGDNIIITASGKWNWGLGDKAKCDANGASKFGWLEAKVGEGQAFKVGTEKSFVAECSGYLKLRMNDSNFTDNSGCLVVTIEKKQFNKR